MKKKVYFFIFFIITLIFLILLSFQIKHWTMDTFATQISPAPVSISNIPAPTPVTSDPILGYDSARGLNCYDSDQGVFPFIEGKIKIKKGGLFQFFKLRYLELPDRCLSDKKTLLEFYCNNTSDKGAIQKISCENGCENGACLINVDESKIRCFEQEKSGLCGINNTIFPLGVQQEEDRIYVSGQGIIFEDENFKISLEAPETFIAHQNYELNLSIQNKRDIVSSFKYYYIACDSSSSCARIYENFIINNLLGAVFTDNGKDKYYSVEFASLEQKKFAISFTPKKPTLTKAPGDLDYLKFYYYPDSASYFMDFQSWIKPGIETYEKEGQIITIQPDLTSCGSNSFPSTIGGLDGIGEGQGASYGYYSSKCCDNVFYPNFECCNNNDCINKDNTDGYCVDGMCIPSTKPQNRLFGTKKILVASDNFNEYEQCTTMNTNSLNSYIRADIDTMERYYDHKANLLLNETTDFINFEVTQVLKLPSSFINFHDYGVSEEQIINKLENMCGINTDDFDIIILPRSVTSMGGAAGFALGIGNSKIVLSTSPNSPTLIHEVGHLFGCIDLYKLSGGRLQWAHNFYGEQKNRQC